jgi:hypothetical protein
LSTGVHTWRNHLQSMPEVGVPLSPRVGVPLTRIHVQLRVGCSKVWRCKVWLCILGSWIMKSSCRRLICVRWWFRSNASSLLFRPLSQPLYQPPNQPLQQSPSQSLHQSTTPSTTQSITSLINQSITQSITPPITPAHLCLTCSLKSPSLQVKCCIKGQQSRWIVETVLVVTH